MNEYRHHVSGFFAHRAAAESALSTLVGLGIPHQRLWLIESDPAAPAPTPPAGSDDVTKVALKDVLVDGAIGTVVGTGLGALAQLALVAANVTLFVANPLIAPLALLGWGAGIGGLIGAATGEFSALIGDAVSNGQVVLVAETLTAEETALAREVLQTAVNNYNEVITA